MLGDSNKYPKRIFYKEIRTKQDHSYISMCSLSILYKSKFILMTMYLGANAVVVTRVHCIDLFCFQSIPSAEYFGTSKIKKKKKKME